MMNKTYTTQIGTINLGDIEFCEDILELSFHISDMSDSIRQELYKASEKAKEDASKFIYNELNLHWSDEGVEMIEDSAQLFISIDKDKTMKTMLCADFEDKSNRTSNHCMECDVAIEVDLSAYIEEIKGMILKAFVNKFF